jgi:hypothetical protein
MPFDVTLIVPAKQYSQYDGANSSDIVDHFTRPYDANRHRFDVTIDSEEDGVLTLSFTGGWRNPENTSWEIYNYGTVELSEGDYFGLVESFNPVQGIEVIPASMIGQYFAIVGGES